MTAATLPVDFAIGNGGRVFKERSAKDGKVSDSDANTIRATCASKRTVVWSLQLIIYAHIEKTINRLLVG